MSGVTARRVRGRLWRPSRPLTDTAVVVALCAVATALALTPVAARSRTARRRPHWCSRSRPPRPTTGAAILAEVAGRICDDPRWSWVAAAFALYGVVVLPVSALAAGGDTPRLLLVRVVAYLTALPLLLVSLRPPRAVGRCSRGCSPSSAPCSRPWPRRSPTTRSPAGPSWRCSPWWCCRAGRRSRSATSSRATAAAAGRGCGSGSGLAVVAVAQLYRGATGAPLTDPVVRRAAAGRRARRARRAGPARRAVARGGALAAVGAAGGAGRRRRCTSSGRGSWRPSGTTSCATASPASPGSPTCSAPARTTSEQQRLRQAVLSELGRLHTILDGGAVGPDPAAARGVRGGAGAGRAGHPAPLGRRAGRPRRRRARRCGRAATRRSSPRSSPTCSPTATGTPPAPRSPCAPTAARDRIVVEVRDEGPGLRSSLGARSAAARCARPGRRRLGAGPAHQRAAGRPRGRRARPAHGHRPRGCLATVRLPAAGRGSTWRRSGPRPVARGRRRRAERSALSINGERRRSSPDSHRSSDPAMS